MIFQTSEKMFIKKLTKKTIASIFFNQNNAQNAPEKNIPSTQAKATNLVTKLDFPKISLNQNIENAAELILHDRKHLDNNPRKVSKEDVIMLLHTINETFILGIGIFEFTLSSF